ncbi:hypothetical protein CDD82_4890 [Ophiocordyceps australis]|uniref:Uncharacterized protein n=1 Tax=Ophiocordyceps australis TaxID=1399860 RepID=A0A2C5Z4A3_9HYPO|nr:hypothetical protein CDD82_4890 [Ophiocordyceps australis]
MTLHPDPLLTDEQLIALFTPKQREIFEWYQENKEVLRDLKFEPNDEWDFICRKFKTHSEQLEYLEFCDIWVSRKLRRMHYMVPVGDFIQLVERTRFNNAEQAAYFHTRMHFTRMPFIEVGTSNCGGKAVKYGFKASDNYLWTNLDNRPNEPGILGRSVLGINLNVNVEYRSPKLLSGPLLPRRRRREQRSSGEESVESAESDDMNHEHGFVFVQIGKLKYFDEHANDSDSDNPTDYTDPDLEKVTNDPWISTGFGVVVQVNSHGQTGAVWVIYNFFEDLAPLKEDQGWEHIDCLDENDALLSHLGRLYPDCAEQFTVAKIANSLQDFRQTRNNFKFDIEARTERQIVRAKILGIHQLVQRQYINRSRQYAF